VASPASNRQQLVLSFFVLAFVWTWAWWGAAAVTGARVTEPAGLLLYLLGVFGRTRHLHRGTRIGPSAWWPPPAAEAVVRRHAPVAELINSVYWTLFTERRDIEFPSAELERASDRSALLR
jgi:hypothetical protein